MSRSMRRVDGVQTFFEPLNPYFGFFYSVKKSLYRGRSRFQKIELLDTDEFGNVLLLDDITQVAEKNDWQYHEPMVHPAMCCHPRPSDILVIGGGDGGILREVLKHRTVRSVTFVELDEKVVEFARAYLSVINNGAFDDPRVETVFSDGRAFVERNRKRFDVVIMDMTDPFGPSRMLYTREFFRAVKRSFKDSRGIFTMHSESPVVRPVAYNCVQKTLGAVFGHVRTMYLYIQMYATYWSVAISSDTIDIAAKTPAAIDRRLRSRGVDGLSVYNGATHRAMQVPFPYVERIRSGPGHVITDRSPDFGDNIHESR